VGVFKMINIKVSRNHSAADAASTQLAEAIAQILTTGNRIQRSGL
jgi:hypothetical protein